MHDDVTKDLAFTGHLFAVREGTTFGVVTRLSSDPGVAEPFAAEREIIVGLIGKPHQVEAITANFENRAPVFKEMG